MSKPTVTTVPSTDALAPATNLLGEPPTPLESAEQHLAQFDEAVQLLWDTGGPRKSRIDRLACFLFTPPGSVPTRILCETFPSGKFLFYAPAQIAAPPTLSDVAGQSVEG